MQSFKSNTSATWSRMELKVPTKQVKDMPKAFIVPDEVFERLSHCAPLPIDNAGFTYYKGTLVFKESDTFKVDGGLFND